MKRTRHVTIKWMIKEERKKNLTRLFCTCFAKKRRVAQIKTAYRKHYKIFWMKLRDVLGCYLEEKRFTLEETFVLILISKLNCLKLAWLICRTKFREIWYFAILRIVKFKILRKLKMNEKFTKTHLQGMQIVRIFLHVPVWDYHESLSSFWCPTILYHRQIQSTTRWIVHSWTKLVNHCQREKKGKAFWDGGSFNECSLTHLLIYFNETSRNKIVLGNWIVIA